jgi:hypothetical protein
MYRVEDKDVASSGPLSSGSMEAQIYAEVARVVAFCKTDDREQTFFAFEQGLMGWISGLGRLFIGLFLAVRHEQLDVGEWGRDSLTRVKNPIARTLKTRYGAVTYWRTYVVKKGGGGFHPLDAVLGLTRDGFSPQLISVVTRVATWVSFAVATRLCRSFLDWSPSTESIECLVLGLGRQGAAYMEGTPPPEGDGPVLVIEVDGKATPTATAAELRKRRGSRGRKSTTSCPCGCQRHRGQDQRRRRKRRRRGRGDKSKNGRSITLVVMYTLKPDADGKLHGPFNKCIWGSYAPREVMMNWARRQATKRGFSPDTDPQVHIVMDGERCLYNGMQARFPQATFALDIRHLEEKLWGIGRVLYKEGSPELEEWIDAQKTLLYTGKAANIVATLNDLLEATPTRGPGTKTRREALTSVIGYMQRRLDMMRYDELIAQDLVIASGIVEGAARYVVGERMDGAGMRWIRERAEALLHLRCIELNGHWDAFFDWAHQRWRQKLLNREAVQIRTNEPIQLPEVA